jgi:hypothetical protein
VLKVEEVVRTKPLMSRNIFPMMGVLVSVPVYSGHVHLCPVATRKIQVNFALARVGAEISVGNLLDETVLLRVSKVCGTADLSEIILEMAPVPASVFGFEVGHDNNMGGWCIIGNPQSLKGSHS